MSDNISFSTLTTVMKDINVALQTSTNNETAINKVQNIKLGTSNKKVGSYVANLLINNNLFK